MRIFEELQTNLDEPGSFAEVVVGLSEAALESLALPLDVVQPRADLGLGQGAIGGQVEEVVLAGVQVAQLSGELLMEQLGRRLLLADGPGQVSLYVSDELWAEAHGGVVVLDGLLQTADVDVGQLTDVASASGAEEVGVDVAVSVLGEHEDHAALGAGEVFAASAEQ